MLVLRMRSSASTWCMLLWSPASFAFLMLGPRQGLGVLGGLGPLLSGLPLPTGLPSLPSESYVESSTSTYSSPTSSLQLTSSGTETTTVPVSSTAISVPTTSTVPSPASSGDIPSSLSTAETQFSATGPSTTAVKSTTLVAGANAMPTESAEQLSSGVSTSHSGSHTLTIALSTVFGVVGVVSITAGILLCLRYRRKRPLFLARGSTPIDDDEIEGWKHGPEKSYQAGNKVHIVGSVGTNESARSKSTAPENEPSGPGIDYPHQDASASPKPSCDIYRRPRASTEGSIGKGSRWRPSFDRDPPSAPAPALVQARAPNARSGLTDEALAGADPFVSSSGRHPARLSKVPTGAAAGHARTRSSRSSRSSASGRSAAEPFLGGAGSEMEMQPSTRSPPRAHSRIYSSSSVPPPISPLAISEDGQIGVISPLAKFRSSDDIRRAAR